MNPLSETSYDTKKKKSIFSRQLTTVLRQVAAEGRWDCTVTATATVTPFTAPAT